MWVNIYFLIKLFESQLDGIKISDVLVSILLALVATLIFAYTCKVKRHKTSVAYLLLVFWSVLYFEITLLITLFRREPGTLYHSGDIITYFQWGALRGDIYSKRQFFYNILNVILFIPIGFLLRGLRTQTFGIKDDVITAFMGFLLSFFIEITQIFTQRGTFEITDLITNFAGACLGVIIFEFLKRIFRYEGRKEKIID